MFIPFLLPMLLFGQTPIQQKEVVKQKARFSITDYKKPQTVLLPFALQPVESIMAKREKELSLKISGLSESYFYSSIKFHSQYINVPVENSIIKEKVSLEIPHLSQKSRKWKFTIIDPFGRVVREYDGKGKPPKEVIWNGKNGDNFIFPGATYSAILTYLDEYGRKREIIGNDIVFPGICGKSKDKYFASVAADYIFQKGSYKLKPDAEEHLDEIANFIKIHYANGVIIKLISDVSYITEKRIAVLKKELKKRLPIDPSNIQIKSGYFGNDDIKITRIDIITG